MFPAREFYLSAAFRLLRLTALPFRFRIYFQSEFSSADTGSVFPCSPYFLCQAYGKLWGLIQTPGPSLFCTSQQAVTNRALNVAKLGFNLYFILQVKAYFSMLLWIQPHPLFCIVVLQKVFNIWTLIVMSISNNQCNTVLWQYCMIHWSFTVILTRMISNYPLFNAFHTYFVSRSEIEDLAVSP